MTLGPVTLGLISSVVKKMNWMVRRGNSEFIFVYVSIYVYVYINLKKSFFSVMASGIEFRSSSLAASPLTLSLPNWPMVFPSPLSLLCGETGSCWMSWISLCRPAGLELRSASASRVLALARLGFFSFKNT